MQSCEGRSQVYPAEKVAACSDAIGDALAAFAAELGLDDLDLAPVLRAAGGERALHGPRDWQHLNQDGYTVLGETVADRIAAGAVQAAPPVDPEVAP